MGRVLTKHESTNMYWTFGYDAQGNLTLAKKGTTAGGQQIAISQFTYDPLSRLTRQSQQIGSSTALISDYEYDQAGRVTSMDYPGSAPAIGRSYTDLGQINQISRGASVLADYDYVGDQVASIMLETGTNDVTATRSYDGAGRLTRLQYAQTGNTLPDLQYAYDQSSAITDITESHRANQAMQFAYDALNRLTGAIYDTRSLTHGFDFDDLGNRLTLHESSGSTSTATPALYNAANEMTRLDAAQVLYDAAGNLTKDAPGVASAGGYTYHYDADSKLTLIRKSNDTVDVASYTYDALGRRIEFVDHIASETKRYYHEGAGDRVLVETDGSDSRQRYYIWGNYIDELLMLHDQASSADRFVCVNHQFSPVALLDDTGSVVETYQYDAFGQPTVHTATATGGGDGDWWDGDEPESASSDLGLVYLFTGREMDVLDSGSLKLNYHRARYYDFQRWLTRDPLGYPDGMNAYTPYHVLRGGVDPSGMFVKTKEVEHPIKWKYKELPLDGIAIAILISEGKSPLHTYYKTVGTLKEYQQWDCDEGREFLKIEIEFTGKISAGVGVSTKGGTIGGEHGYSAKVIDKKTGFVPCEFVEKDGTKCPGEQFISKQKVVLYRTTGTNYVVYNSKTTVVVWEIPWTLTCPCRKIKDDETSDSSGSK